ncbi:MAG TPA: hypothetical protein VF708_02030 [Pyrinomonadaceae bacterium]|jgi:hypothetical protein
MPVIGRLDEQVDAVLIKPLERRGEPAGDDTAARSNENIAQPQSAIPKGSETDAQAHERAEQEELPVWLL